MLWLIWLTIVVGFVVLFLFVQEVTRRIRVGIVALLNKVGDTTVDRYEM